MADAESSEALQLRNPKLQHEKQQKDSEGDDENEEDEEGEQRGEEEQKRVIELPVTELQTGKLRSSVSRQEADTGGSNSETLAVPSSLESVGNDRCTGELEFQVVVFCRMKIVPVSIPVSFLKHICVVGATDMQGSCATQMASDAASKVRTFHLENFCFINSIFCLVWPLKVCVFFSYS